MKQKNYLKMFLLSVAVLGATEIKTLAEELRKRAATNSRAAVNVVTLDGLVAEALEKNPELHFYKAEIAAAKGERRSAGTFPNPELNADIGRKRATGGGLSAEGTAWSVSVMQPFEFPGRLALRKSIANRQIELAEIGYAQFRAALVARVRTLGYGLGVAQQKADAAEQVAQRGQELAEVIVQRDPAGITPLLETRIIEGSVITAKRRAALAVRDAQVALYDLNQLRGAPLSSPITIATSDLKFPAPVPVETFVAIARTNNFEIRSREVELAQQGLRVDLSKNERWPSVTAGPFYSQEKAGEKERVVGIGISMPLPLWNRNNGNIEAAAARTQQAEATFAVTLRQVEKDVRERAAAYNAFVEQMSFWRTNTLDQLREAAELGDRHYRLGSLPVATYVELQDKYIEATEAILDTQRDAMESRQQLDLLTGKFSTAATELPKEEAE